MIFFKTIFWFRKRGGKGDFFHHLFENGDLRNFVMFFLDVHNLDFILTNNPYHKNVYIFIYFILCTNLAMKVRGDGHLDGAR